MGRDERHKLARKKKFETLNLRLEKKRLFMTERKGRPIGNTYYSMPGDLRHPGRLPTVHGT